jgi:hypothetical protein
LEAIFTVDGERNIVLVESDITSFDSWYIYRWNPQFSWKKTGVSNFKLMRSLKLFSFWSHSVYINLNYFEKQPLTARRIYERFHSFNFQGQPQSLEKVSV